MYKETDSLRSWYEQMWLEGRYDRLIENVVKTLRHLLRIKRIAFLSINGRLKTLDSFLKKAELKNYADPCIETTDLAGIRIITFIEQDVERVAGLLPTTFQVHSDKSPNKEDELGVDRFGYRSRHFVCDLGKTRLALPKCKDFDGLLFEVQVRTVLQHAWAEVEHDRIYKFPGVPAPLKRRFNLIAGMLEIADHEFDNLVRELEDYRRDVLSDIKAGGLDVDYLIEHKLFSTPAEIVACLRFLNENSLPDDAMDGFIEDQAEIGVVDEQIAAAFDLELVISDDELERNPFSGSDTIITKFSLTDLGIEILNEAEARLSSP